jgi:hypothetical protein
VSADQVDAADLRRQIATRDQRIAALEAENARIVREARMAAVDKGDGSPSRLAAARKAGRQTDDGFGGKE